MAPHSPQGASQPDLTTALQHRDDHGVGHPDTADKQGDRAHPQQQAGESLARRVLGLQRVRGARDLDLVRRLRGDRGCQQLAHLGDRRVLAAGVHRGRLGVVPQLAGGDLLTDKRGGVELRGQDHRLEDADHREPPATKPHLGAWGDDTQTLSRRMAQDRGRVLAGGLVEPGAPVDLARHDV